MRILILVRVGSVPEWRDNYDNTPEPEPSSFFQVEMQKLLNLLKV